jgi:hypothetical protein
MVVAAAGIGDKHIDRPEPLLDVPAHRFNLVKLRDVSRDMNGVSAIRLDFGLHGRKCRCVSTVNSNLGAMPGEKPCDARANSARTAGDKSHPVLEPLCL